MRRGAEAGCGILTAGHGESIAIVETLVLCEFSGAAAVAAGGGVSVDVVIVAHNRPATLVRTLAELALVAAEVGGAVSLAVTIVDNASLAPIGVSDADEASAARVRLVRREQNAGILAFNEGAALGRAEFLFILDDDAWPDAGSLVEGLRVLRATPRLGAVALHPTHPVTKRGEWEFANGERAKEFQSFEQQAYRRLELLEAAPNKETLMRFPSNHFEALGGDRKGQYSIRINLQWRICFEWFEGESQPFNIEIVDYH